MKGKKPYFGSVWDQNQQPLLSENCFEPQNHKGWTFALGRSQIQRDWTCAVGRSQIQRDWTCAVAEPHEDICTYLQTDSWMEKQTHLTLWWSNTELVLEWTTLQWKGSKTEGKILKMHKSMSKREVWKDEKSKWHLLDDSHIVWKVQYVNRLETISFKAVFMDKVVLVSTDTIWYNQLGWVARRGGGEPSVSTRSWCWC